jgi:hypothetical protein
MLGWNLVAEITATSPYAVPLNKSWPLFVKEVKDDLLNGERAHRSLQEGFTNLVQAAFVL